MPFRLALLICCISCICSAQLYPREFTRSPFLGNVIKIKFLDNTTCVYENSDAIDTLTYEPHRKKLNLYKGNVQFLRLLVVEMDTWTVEERPQDYVRLFQESNPSPNSSTMTLLKIINTKSRWGGGKGGTKWYFILLGQT